jgi:hypothetical protein
MQNRQDAEPCKRGVPSFWLLDAGRECAGNRALIAIASSKPEVRTQNWSGQAAAPGRLAIFPEPLGQKSGCCLQLAASAEQVKNRWRLRAGDEAKGLFGSQK